jgi:multiple sugar transport system permease protein
MKTRTLLAFVAPSLFMMVVFIALPVVSVFVAELPQYAGPYSEKSPSKAAHPGFLRQICSKESPV